MKTVEEIPESLPSGKLLLRMPRTLHAELARAADAEGVSLNQFIIGALSGSISWRGAEDGARPRSRALTIMLAANLLVLALAATVAVVALVLAVN